MKKTFLFLFLMLFAGICAGATHKSLKTSNNHEPWRWKWADSTARVGTSITDEDTMKIGFQLSDSTMWVLLDSPAVWGAVQGYKNMVDLTVSDSLYAAKLASPSVNIDGGAIDGATIGGSSAGVGTFTTLNATGGGSLTGTWSDLGTVTTIDVNGGTVDNATIGASTPSTGAFTTLSTTGNATLGNASVDAHTVNGTLTINPGTQAYKLSNPGVGYLMFEGQSAASNAFLLFAAADGDGADYVGIDLYAVGNSSNTTNTERFRSTWNPSTNTFDIYSFKSGTGTSDRPFRLAAGSSNLGSQLNLNTDGSIDIGGNLTVSGNLSATSSAVTFATVNTGQGANELYDMDQNVTTTSDVTFNTVNGMTFSDTAVACTLSRSTSGIVYDGTPDTVGTIMFVKMGRIVSAYLYGISVTIDTVTSQGSGIYLETNELPQTYEHTRNYFDNYPHIPYSVAASGVNGANVVRSYGNGSNFKLRYHVQDGGSNWQGSNSDIFFKNVNITYICD